MAFRNAFRSAAVHTALLRERLRSGAVYNPAAERTVQDPYPDYSRLRRRSPAHFSHLFKSWVFSRHAEVDSIMRNHGVFSSDPTKRHEMVRQQTVLNTRKHQTMLIADPPDHTRLRALVARTFIQKSINSLEPWIRRLMNALVDEIADPSSFDLMTAVANPLPVLVISEMLGIPAEDRGDLRNWSNRQLSLLEPIPDPREHAFAIEALDVYLRSVIERKRARPTKDIVNELVNARRNGAALTEQEVVNMLRLLLVTGNETTTNLIGNGMLALLRHPDQHRRLRDDPGLVPAAVEEFLRFDSPVQTAIRIVLEDCQVAGSQLLSGQGVILLIGSANRDPQVFDNPDMLDVDRHTNSHIAFGRGIHHCMGASLARLEGRIAFEVLLERFSSISLLSGTPKYRSGVILRGLESLPVKAVPS